MNYFNKTLLILITAFQVSAMAETTEIQLIIERLINPDSHVRKLIVTPLTNDVQIRKNELLDIFAQTLRDLNNISLEIFDRDLSLEFITGVKATIEKIININLREYKNYENRENLYLELLESRVFDVIDTKNFYHLFMYFQLRFRIDNSMIPKDMGDLNPEKRELIINQGELFDTIYKYYLLTYTGIITTESFDSYMTIKLKKSNSYIVGKLKRANFYDEELKNEVNKIVEHAKQKREHALNPTGAIKE